jgi:pilus assembly protein CpaC
MTKRLTAFFPGSYAVALALAVLLLAPVSASAFFVPINRAELITAKEDIGQVIVANPEIADVYAHGGRHVSIIGKKLGHTNVRIFDKSGKVLTGADVTVGFDLPAIRKALWKYLPDEKISVEMMNTNVVLTGNVSSNAVADRAVRIVTEFMKEPGAPDMGTATAGAAQRTTVLNLMQVAASQQVTLRVRVGEIRRTALKDIGVSLQANNARGRGTIGGATGGGIGNPFGTFNGFADSQGNSAFGNLFALYNGTHFDLGAALEALEQDGLFKVLAEPNLVAISGEKAEFLAGGELPVPSAQSTGVGTTNTVEFKPYGVAVQFVPIVLSDNKIRITVQPEVSEIDPTVSTTANGLTIPGFITRRAKTTVELAPGESFMIAGLLQDRLDTTINQIPGLNEIPILSALFRSSEFRRNETELVIAVTPYIVDPLKSSDVRLPTDDFRPASTMERFFYGALGTLNGNASRISQTPQLEGPIGFMTD